MGPYQRTPFSKLLIRAIRYSGFFGVHFLWVLWVRFLGFFIWLIGYDIIGYNKSHWTSNPTNLIGPFTLPETNTSPLKMDGWNTILSYWGPGLFSGGFAVSFREGIPFSWLAWDLRKASPNGARPTPRRQKRQIQLVPPLWRGKVNRKPLR